MAARGAVACALAVCAVAAGSVTLPCKRPLVYGDDDSEDDTEAAVLYSVLQNAAQVDDYIDSSSARRRRRPAQERRRAYPQVRYWELSRFEIPPARFYVMFRMTPPTFWSLVRDIYPEEFQEGNLYTVGERAAIALHRMGARAAADHTAELFQCAVGKVSGKL